MGIFDRFRRSRAPANGGDEPPQQAPPRVRTFHYAFAHCALPWLTGNHPVFFLGIYQEEQGFAEGMIQQLLDYASMVSTEKVPSFGRDGLDVVRTVVAGYRCLVFVLPPPTATPEAYMAALLLIDPKEGKPTGPMVLRNFTLEYNDVFRPAHGVFCEWAQDKSKHFNHGAGPEPTVEAFLARIEAFMSAEATRG